MNFMNYLGFSKKGTERPEEKQDNNRNVFRFTDKYPRDEKETRICNLVKKIK